MKELVEVIAKSLVDNPDEVVVTQTESGNDLLIELKVGALRHGKSDRKTGTHCESDPHRCQGGFLKKRQESSR